MSLTGIDSSLNVKGSFPPIFCHFLQCTVNDLRKISGLKNLSKVTEKMLQQLVEFSVPVEDLIQILILYIRSVSEQSCQVWHSSLTFENLTDVERVQKNALKIILKGSVNSKLKLSVLN